jgi:hypothetical protein
MNTIKAYMETDLQEPTLIRQQVVSVGSYRHRLDFEDILGYEYSELEPWMPYTSDFVKNDFYYDVTRPYRIWYEYLRLSPTFALAEKYLKTNGALTEEESKQCPEDFLTSVVPTCSDMKLSIGSYDFDIWWLRHGADLFGKRRLQAEPVNLMTSSHHSEIDEVEINMPFKRYLTDERPNNGNPGFMIVAIPLSGDKKTVIKSVQHLINTQEFLPLGMPGKKNYDFYGERLREDVLPSNLRVLWHKALEPKLSLWKLGIKAKASDSWPYTDLNPETDAGTPASKVLASITSNKLKAAVIIMENAARGRFPYDKADLLPPIDQSKLISQVSKKLIAKCSRHDLARQKHLERLETAKREIE